jgi:hypothetical protein
LSLSSSLIFSLFLFFSPSPSPHFPSLSFPLGLRRTLHLLYFSYNWNTSARCKTGILVSILQMKTLGLNGILFIQVIEHLSGRVRFLPQVFWPCSSLQRCYLSQLCHMVKNKGSRFLPACWACPSVWRGLRKCSGWEGLPARVPWYSLWLSGIVEQVSLQPSYFHPAPAFTGGPASASDVLNHPVGQQQVPSS